MLLHTKFRGQSRNTYCRKYEHNYPQTDCYEGASDACSSGTGGCACSLSLAFAYKAEDNAYDSAGDADIPEAEENQGHYAQHHRGDAKTLAGYGSRLLCLSILRLAVLRLAVLRLTVLRLALLRLTVLGLAILGLTVLRLLILRLVILRLSLYRLVIKLVTAHTAVVSIIGIGVTAIRTEHKIIPPYKFPYIILYSATFVNAFIVLLYYP